MLITCNVCSANPRWLPRIMERAGGEAGGQRQLDRIA